MAYGRAYVAFGGLTLPILAVFNACLSLEH